jgi:hypothetical protein
MTKHNYRAILTAGLVSILASLGASAAEPFALGSLSAKEIRNLEIDIPRITPVPQTAYQAAGATAAAQDEAAEASLTQAQWNELFASEQEDLSPLSGLNKELLSDFAARYVINGTLQLDRAPQTFTTLEGKVYKVVKLPKWLKNPGNKELCVEGHIRQQDNTAEIAINTVLPLDAAKQYEPSAATTAIQRHPYILSSDSRGYALANVNWGVQHSASGARLTDANGIFKFIWPKSVTVRPELLEQAYVGKKSMQKFPYAGVHGFLVFKFRPGGVTDAQGRSARGLVVSLNTYSLVPGRQNQGIIDGLRGRYAVHYNINTAEGYVEQNVFTDGNRISFYPLTLPRDRQVKLLKNAIEQAASTRTGEMYSLIYNSCTNAVVSFVNGVLDKDQKIAGGWLPELVYRLRATIPDAATSVLSKRGLVAKPLPYLDETNYTALFAK